MIFLYGSIRWTLVLLQWIMTYGCNFDSALQVSAFFNMATSKYNQRLLCVLIYLFTLTFDVQAVSENVKWLKNISSGRLHLRNLGEKGDEVHTKAGDGGYFRDTRQEIPDSSAFGGIKIDHEAQKLSARLRWLSNEEIGITKMQVGIKI